MDLGQINSIRAGQGLKPYTEAQYINVQNKKYTDAELYEYAHYGTGAVARDAAGIQAAKQQQAAIQAAKITNVDPQKSSGYAFKYTMSHADQNAYLRDKQHNPSLTEYQWRKQHGEDLETIKGGYVAPKMTTSNKSAATTGTKQTGLPKKGADGKELTGSQKIAAQSKTNASTNKATVKSTTKTTTPAKKTVVTTKQAASGNAAKTSTTTKPKTVVTTKQAASGNAAKTTTTTKKTVVTTKQASSGNAAKTTPVKPKTVVTTKQAASGNVARNTASSTSTGIGNVKKVTPPAATKSQNNGVVTRNGLFIPVVRDATGKIVEQETETKPVNPNAARNAIGLSNKLSGSEKIAAQGKGTGKATIINRDEGTKTVVSIKQAASGNAARTTPKPTTTVVTTKPIVSLIAARGANAGHGNTGSVNTGLIIPMAKKTTTGVSNDLTGAEKLAAQSRGTSTPVVVKKTTPVVAKPATTTKTTMVLQPANAQLLQTPWSTTPAVTTSNKTAFFSTTDEPKKSTISSLFGADKSGFGFIGIASAAISAEDRRKYTQDPRFKPCPTGLCSIKWTNDQITKLKAADAQSAQQTQKPTTTTVTTQKPAQTQKPATTQPQVQTQKPTVQITKQTQITTQTPVQTIVESQPITIKREREDPQWHDAVQDLLKEEMMAKYNLDSRGNKIPTSIQLADGSFIEQVQKQGNSRDSGVKVVGADSRITKEQRDALYQQKLAGNYNPTAVKVNYVADGKNKITHGTVTNQLKADQVAADKAAAKAAREEQARRQAEYLKDAALDANYNAINAITDKNNQATISRNTLGQAVTISSPLGSRKDIEKKNKAIYDSLVASGKKEGGIATKSTKQTGSQYYTRSGAGTVSDVEKWNEAVAKVFGTPGLNANRLYNNAAKEVKGTTGFISKEQAERQAAIDEYRKQGKIQNVLGAAYAATDDTASLQASLDKSNEYVTKKLSFIPTGEQIKPGINMLVNGGPTFYAATWMANKAHETVDPVIHRTVENSPVLKKVVETAQNELINPVNTRMDETRKTVSNITLGDIAKIATLPAKNTFIGRTAEYILDHKSDPIFKKAKITLGSTTTAEQQAAIDEYRKQGKVQNILGAIYDATDDTASLVKTTDNISKKLGVLSPGAPALYTTNYLIRKTNPNFTKVDNSALIIKRNAETKLRNSASVISNTTLGQVSTAVHNTDRAIGQGITNFIVDEYDNVRTKPVTAAGEVALIYASGGAFGAGLRAAELGGSRFLAARAAKAAASDVWLTSRAVAPTLQFGSRYGSKILLEAPMAGQLVGQVAGETSKSYAEGGVTGATESVLRTTKDLAIGAAGFSKGSKFVSGRFGIENTKTSVNSNIETTEGPNTNVGIKFKPDAPKSIEANSIGNILKISRNSPKKIVIENVNGEPTLVVRNTQDAISMASELGKQNRQKYQTRIEKAKRDELIANTKKKLIEPIDNTKKSVIKSKDKIITEIKDSNQYKKAVTIAKENPFTKTAKATSQSISRTKAEAKEALKPGKQVGYDITHVRADTKASPWSIMDVKKQAESRPITIQKSSPFVTLSDRYAAAKAREDIFDISQNYKLNRRFGTKSYQDIHIAAQKKAFDTELKNRRIEQKNENFFKNEYMREKTPVELKAEQTAKEVEAAKNLDFDTTLNELRDMQARNLELASQERAKKIEFEREYYKKLWDQAGELPTTEVMPVTELKADAQLTQLKREQIRAKKDQVWKKIQAKSESEFDAELARLKKLQELQDMAETSARFDQYMPDQAKLTELQKNVDSAMTKYMDGITKLQDEINGVKPKKGKSFAERQARMKKLHDEANARIVEERKVIEAAKKKMQKEASAKKKILPDDITDVARVKEGYKNIIVRRPYEGLSLGKERNVIDIAKKELIELESAQAAKRKLSPEDKAFNNELEAKKEADFDQALQNLKNGLTVDGKPKPKTIEELMKEFDEAEKASDNPWSTPSDVPSDPLVDPKILAEFNRVNKGSKASDLFGSKVSEYSIRDIKRNNLLKPRRDTKNIVLKPKKSSILMVEDRAVSEMSKFEPADNVVKAIEDADTVELSNRMRAMKKRSAASWNTKNPKWMSSRDKSVDNWLQGMEQRQKSGWMSDTRSNSEIWISNMEKRSSGSSWSSKKIKPKNVEGPKQVIEFSEPIEGVKVTEKDLEAALRMLDNEAAKPQEIRKLNIKPKTKPKTIEYIERPKKTIEFSEPSKEAIITEEAAEAALKMLDKPKKDVFKQSQQKKQKIFKDVRDSYGEGQAASGSGGQQLMYATKAKPEAKPELNIKTKPKINRSETETKKISPWDKSQNEEAKLLNKPRRVRYPEREEAKIKEKTIEEKKKKSIYEERKTTKYVSDRPITSGGRYDEEYGGRSSYWDKVSPMRFGPNMYTSTRGNGGSGSGSPWGQSYNPNTNNPSNVKPPKPIPPNTNNVIWNPTDVTNIVPTKIDVPTDEKTDTIVPTKTDEIIDEKTDEKIDEIIQTQPPEIIIPIIPVPIEEKLRTKLVEYEGFIDYKKQKPKELMLKPKKKTLSMDTGRSFTVKNAALMISKTKVNTFSEMMGRTGTKVVQGSETKVTKTERPSPFNKKVTMSTVQSITPKVFDRAEKPLLNKMATIAKTPAKVTMGRTVVIQQKTPTTTRKPTFSKPRSQSNGKPAMQMGAQKPSKNPFASSISRKPSSSQPNSSNMFGISQKSNNPFGKSRKSSPW